MGTVDGAQRVVVRHLQDDGVFPNNSQLPLLVYVGALRLPEADPAAAANMKQVTPFTRSHMSAPFRGAGCLPHGQD